MGGEKGVWVLALNLGVFRVVEIMGWASGCISMLVSQSVVLQVASGQRKDG